MLSNYISSVTIIMLSNYFLICISVPLRNLMGDSLMTVFTVAYSILLLQVLISAAEFLELNCISAAAKLQNVKLPFKLSRGKM